MSDRKRILFILPYPLGKAPSQRFRVEAFFPLLVKNGYQFSSQTFFDDAAWRVLYAKSSLPQKAWAVIKGFAKRWYVLLVKAWRYDYLFIHREATPIGVPFFEWIAAKVLRRKIIYDFDDAIWIPNTTKENRLVAWVKAFWKVKYICRWAHKISGGNDYLCAYAKTYNRNVMKLPTCVDTETRHNVLKAPHTGRLTIGWTGSHSTMHYLDEIVPVIRQLQEANDFEFLVISNKAPELDLKNWKYIPWKEETEIADLLKMDIGVMPLKHDAWSEGKCGFKLIQYLALGIPAAASPVGVNKLIVEQGKTGYFCSTPQEWHEALSVLLSDAALRQEMGQLGRKKIVAGYSLQAHEQTFLQLFTPSSSDSSFPNQQ